MVDAWLMGWIRSGVVGGDLCLLFSSLDFKGKILIGY